jgi:hypothetical protein
MDKTIIGLLSGASALALMGGAQAFAPRCGASHPARKFVRGTAGAHSERG